MEAVLVNHYDAKVKCEELYGNTIHQSVTQQNAKSCNEVRIQAFVPELTLHDF